MIRLQQILQNHSDEEAKDCWTWRLNGKGQYTAKKFYKLVHDPIQANPLLNWIWKSCCILKTKVFAWLVIMDRLNTKDMLIRRHWNIQDGPECKARYAVLFQIWTLPSKPEDEAHIGPHRHI